MLGDRPRDEGVEGGRGGAVVVSQRFGGALNLNVLNVHVHALVPDGIFAGDVGKLVFHRVGRLTALDAEEVLAARANGHSLHAGLVVPAEQREQLERVCRDVLRPPVAIDRLHLTEDGRVRLSRRHPWSDGTTGLAWVHAAGTPRAPGCARAVGRAST